MNRIITVGQKVTIMMMGAATAVITTMPGHPGIISTAPGLAAPMAERIKP